MIRLTILFACLFALSCNAPKNANPSVEGTNWVLVSYVSLQTEGQVQDAIADREANLLMQDGKVNGSTGCNRYNGGYTLQDDKMEASQLVMTKMFCQDAAIQEKAFMTVMNANPTVVLEKDQLTLATPKGEKLIFRKGSETPSKPTSDANTPSGEEKKLSQEAALVAEKDEKLVTTARAIPDGNEKDPPLQGMFAYMADAALFTNCADGKKYPVAMENAFPEVTKAYRRAVGDEGAGSFAFVMLEGSFRERPGMEGGLLKPTLVVDKVIGFSRGASCKTDIQLYTGLYSYSADASFFQDCNGKRYPVSDDSAKGDLFSAYAKTGVEPPEPVFVEVEGYLSEDDGKETILHVFRDFGFRKGVGCP